MPGACGNLSRSGRGKQDRELARLQIGLEALNRYPDRNTRAAWLDDGAGPLTFAVGWKYADAMAPSPLKLTARIPIQCHQTCLWSFMAPCQYAIAVVTGLTPHARTYARTRSHTCPTFTEMMKSNSKSNSIRVSPNNVQQVRPLTCTP